MSRAIAALAAGLIPLACFVTVLVVGVPGAFDLEAHGGALPLVPVLVLGGLGLLLAAAFGGSGRPARTLACAVTLVLFAIPLAAVWHSGRTNGSHAAGLVPLNDAALYYHCASLLAEGEPLRASPASAFCSRRPMFVSAFAGILTLARRDLRQSLAVMILLVALSCHLAAREIRQSVGAGGAALFLMVLALFHRRHAGAVLTEHLGLALGALGLAGLWRSARTGAFAPALAGLFLLTLALNARAGAFLVLPAMLGWIAWRFRPARPPWRTLGLGVLVVAAAFGLNAALVRAIGTPAGLFSNFSYTLYGLVFGGDWTLVLSHHPELRTLPPIEQSEEVLRLAMDGIARDPGRLLAGALRAWGEFLGTSYPFAFVHRGLVNLSLRLLTVAGLLVWLFRRREPVPSLLLVAVLGLVASVPFAPPWDADLMRAYAATMPVLAAAAALGAAAILGRLLPLRRALGRLTRRPADGAGAGAAIHALGLTLLILTFGSPVLLATRAGLPRFPAADPACQALLHVRPPRGSMVTVLPAGAAGRYPGVLALDELRRGTGQVAPVYPELVRALTGPPTPFVLFAALDLGGPRPAIVAAPMAGLPSPLLTTGVWRICADRAQDARVQAFGLYHAVSVTLLTP